MSYRNPNLILHVVIRLESRKLESHLENLRGNSCQKTSQGQRGPIRNFGCLRENKQKKEKRWKIIDLNRAKIPPENISILT